MYLGRSVLLLRAGDSLAIQQGNLTVAIDRLGSKEYISFRKKGLFATQQDPGIGQAVAE